MNGTISRSLWITLAIALASCGGGGSADNSDNPQNPDNPANPLNPPPSGKAECPNQFVASGSQVSTSCGIACQDPENGRQAIDGNRSSFATLTGSLSDSGTGDTTIYSVPASRLDLRATAPSGASFPAGTKAGAIVQLASGDATTQQLVTVTTYLGGTLQETFNGGSQASSVQSPQDRVFSYPTTKAYDAVQFSVEVSRPAGTARPQVKVYEFCG